jgi:uncharacterized protein (TIGR03435 family)
MSRIAVILVALICAPILIAQQPAPAFEVASVKRNTSGEPRPSGGGPQPNGRYRLINATPEMLISFAYLSIPPERFIGAPGWIKTERYDLIATADPNIRDGKQFSPLLQSLLRARFQLQVHTESRNLPAFDLVMSRRDGALGPQIRRSRINCDDVDAVKAAQAASPSESVCRGVAGAASMTLRGIPVHSLAALLSSRVGRPVLDRTGLAGYFDMDLAWAPTVSTAPSAAPANDGPSIYTALQEQLGLRLQPSSAAQDVLIIDHIERPTPD